MVGGKVWRLLVPLLVVTAAGCGSGRYPVTGKVAFEDGSPLDEGTVSAEATIDGKLVAARGNIQNDGSFQLGTERPGDGALPGKYRVVVLPRALGDSENAQGMKPAVADKFTRFDTSGITHEVPNGPSELNIRVTRPKGK